MRSHTLALITGFILAAQFEALYQANEQRSLSGAATSLKIYGATAGDRTIAGVPAEFLDEVDKLAAPRG